MNLVAPSGAGGRAQATADHRHVGRFAVVGDQQRAAFAVFEETDPKRDEGPSSAG
jgi:hypothetical protein